MHPTRTPRVTATRFVGAALGLAWRLVPPPLARAALSALRARPDLTDRWGFHVRRAHYYEPLPDFARIQRADLETRRVPSAIDFDLDAQRARAQSLARRYHAELVALDTSPEGPLPYRERYFGSLDAAVYYALLRDLRPRRVVEIGVGTSTRIAARALARNRAEGAPATLIGIDPHPQPRLTAHDVEVELHRTELRSEPLATFEALAAGDVLFLDADHVAKHGSATTHAFLEILPRLRPGVWVHVHDVYFPTDYPPAGLIDARVAYNEQYLLAAFLAFNAHFAPRLALRWLWLDHATELARAWPAPALPRPTELSPTSFWMERVTPRIQG